MDRLLDLGDEWIHSQVKRRMRIVAATGRRPGFSRRGVAWKGADSPVSIGFLLSSCFIMPL